MLAMMRREAIDHVIDVEDLRLENDSRVMILNEIENFSFPYFRTIHNDETEIHITKKSGEAWIIFDMADATGDRRTWPKSSEWIS